MDLSKTNRVTAVVVVAIFFVASVNSDASSYLKCSPPDPKRTVNLTIEWGKEGGVNQLTEFTIRGGAEQIAELKSLDILQTVIKCDGEDVVQIKGILRRESVQKVAEEAKVDIINDIDFPASNVTVTTFLPDFQVSNVTVTNFLPDFQVSSVTPTSLLPVTGKFEPEVFETTAVIPTLERYHCGNVRFYERTGTNIELKNDRCTASRMNAERFIGDGSLITDRHLKNDEMFQVRLDKTMQKWGRSISLGVTTQSPSEVNFLNHWYWQKSGVWIYYLYNIFHDGKDIRPSYGVNLETLKVGDRLGVMRKRNGSLHFFVNGLDQGAIPGRVPKKIYAVMDLYGSAVEATIV